MDDRNATSDQLDLFSWPAGSATIVDPSCIDPAIENNPKPKRDLRIAAERWIHENPDVYRMFERFALELAARGRPFGIGLIAERVRWECLVSVFDKTGWKVNNNHRAYVARRLVMDHPELESLMEFRETYW